MKKKNLFKLLPVLLIGVILTSCGEYSSRMTFGTGGTAGTYYAYGGVLSQYMRKYAGIRVTAVSTGGSKANIQSIGDKDYQLGFAQSDVMTYAWEGVRAFEYEGKTTDFRVLGALYNETVQLITMDKNIKSVKDLKGKRVSIGASGSGVYFNAVDVLNGADLSIDDIKPQYQSFEDSKEALKDGKIDAAFIVAGAPTSAITELATTNGVYFVNIDEKIREKIMNNCPYYESQTLEKGTYPGIDSDIETITVKAVLLVSKDATKEEVYNLTSSIFSNINNIKSENAKGEELSLTNATSIKNVPYHVGASMYYEENGFEVYTID